MLLILLAFNSGQITTSIGALTAIVAAISASFSIKSNRQTARATETSAEGNSIKAIAEANTLAVQNLREETDRLSTVVKRLNDRLNAERQWVVRLIRALNTAGIEIPARPENAGSDADVAMEVDDTIAQVMEAELRKQRSHPPVA